MTDLHKQFVELGRERNKITYQLLALLPKIYRAKIHEKQGYATIYEYADRIAGLPKSVVVKTLNLENALKNKPHLQKMIETQGVHKVAIVARLATPETDGMFADKEPGQKAEDYTGVELTYYKVFDDSDVIEPFINEYLAAHPGLKIRYRKFVDFDEYQKTILDEMAEVAISATISTKIKGFFRVNIRMSLSYFFIITHYGDFPHIFYKHTRHTDPAA